MTQVLKNYYSTFFNLFPTPLIFNMWVAFWLRNFVWERSPGLTVFRFWFEFRKSFFFPLLSRLVSDFYVLFPWSLSGKTVSAWKFLFCFVWNLCGWTFHSGLSVEVATSRTLTAFWCCLDFWRMLSFFFVLLSEFIRLFWCWNSMCRLICDIKVCVGAVISLNFDCFSILTRVSETRFLAF